ncbi:calpain-A-like isoform X4 [Mizuhopecten yessoensis]|uniref:calpain-A-like isoform X4 n=1 Tax=Mizuhopecten yessoensis TaxID=6573 RepID=UPI000B45A430|nr:calpain-A-like isoform X4 [Mizuhopecten yessoensis]
MFGFKSGGSRTVTTSYSSGGGPVQTTTKTFRYGGDGPGMDVGSGENGGTDINVGFGNKFGGMGNYKFNIGGGSARGGGRSTQRPNVCGRASRKEKKNPFSGVLNQNYDQIKAKCLDEGILFEDPEFEATDMSIFFSKRSPRPFEWKRPTEISDNPQFIDQHGASRFDVQQGELGDCWLLAATASLTCNKTLFARVVPADQNFTDDYCGLFRFHFWHQGDWVEVLVDDRLPTYYNKLVFMHSAENNEFWSALFEKAYAKLQGSYESLKGGSTCEAMEDFTGGVTEMFDLRKPDDNLLSIMLKASTRGSLMGCSIDADPNQLEAVLENGLVMGHAYSVTSVQLVDIRTPRTSGRFPMVRVRNPWGNEAEWKGAWSDQSEEWRFIPEEEKKNIGLTFDDDGEFWMSFSDWKANFQKLEICNLGPDSLDEDEIQAGGKRWEATTESGEWIPRVNAGGCRNYLDTFWTNPQYKVTLVDPDEDEDDLCTMLVGILQKDRRKKRKEGLDLLTIGYVIYKLKENMESDGPLDIKFFKYNASTAKSPSFVNMREICGRHKLPPGTYVIVPSTFEPHQKGEYLVRIFSEKASESGEMDQPTGMVDDQSGLASLERFHVYTTTKEGEVIMSTPEDVPAVASAPSTQSAIQIPVAVPEREVNEPTPVPPIPEKAAARGVQKFHHYPPSSRSGHTAPSSARRKAPTRNYDHMSRREALEVLYNALNEEIEPTDEEQEQEAALKGSFRRVAGEDLEVDAYELQGILNAVFTKDFKFSGFSVECCRSMVAMHDGDMSGKLGFDEFKDLWNDLRKWKGVFKERDADSSGCLSSYELRQALHMSGFRLSNRSLSALVLRYSNKESQIEFGDFILAAIRLKTMLSSFKSRQHGDMAGFEVDDFIQTTMYS